MYVVDGIAYAGDMTAPITVVSVRVLESYVLWLRFSTGEVKIFDFTPLLDSKVFQPLRDMNLFRDVYLDYGVTVWNEGDIDIAPEYLYEHSVAT
jgi:hypothetical protein